MNDPVFWQWILLIGFGVMFFFLAPLSRSAKEFFSATSPGGKQPGVFLLTTSLVISWIFAKSITNAANLGMAFGIVGGVAYAVYYLSFLVAGIVIYKMRTKGGFKSIHHFLETRFGKAAVLIFSLLIGFRLFNEVWSNTMVIGSYFGEAGSSPYYWSILIFTVLTLAYTLKGGLRSSLLTDGIQMIFFGILLFVLLTFVLGAEKGQVGKFLTSGKWEMAAGVNLVLVAFLQIFSYPFHDSVMTDRGFISDPKTTLKSFIWAAGIGFFCLVAFSFVGIFAQFRGLDGEAPVAVGKLMGVAAMLSMNFIMVTSAASTLDSAFSSFSKLITVDILKSKDGQMKLGRWMMVLITVAGTLPVFANPKILSATTVSGTMVMGLAPVFLLWRFPARKLSFFLSVGAGIVIGIVHAIGKFPSALVFSEGKYNDLLFANLWGILLCFILFLIPSLFNRKNELKNT